MRWFVICRESVVPVPMIRCNDGGGGIVTKTDAGYVVGDIGLFFSDLFGTSGYNIDCGIVIR